MKVRILKKKMKMKGEYFEKKNTENECEYFEKKILKMKVSKGSRRGRAHPRGM